MSDDILQRVQSDPAFEKDEIRVPKIATIVLDVAFEKQNVAFMMGLAFSIPVLPNTKHQRSRALAGTALTKRRQGDLNVHA